MGNAPLRVGRERTLAFVTPHGAGKAADLLKVRVKNQEKLPGLLL
jgi:hypothetical protein